MSKKQTLADTRELDLSPPPEQPKRAMFRITIEGKEQLVSYQQAFAFAHRLLRKNQYENAAKLLEPLTKVEGRGPRAHILLAICRASNSDFAGAREVLDRAFTGDEAVVASELQDVIVMTRVGFWKTALQDLVKLVNKHKELPTLCLWLGDMLAAKQELDKAVQCWQLAIQRDRPDGAVGLAAREQLAGVQSAPRRPSKQKKA
jgi:thioredoxin-like negative regulator of GroEL